MRASRPRSALPLAFAALVIASAARAEQPDVRALRTAGPAPHPAGGSVPRPPSFLRMAEARPQPALPGRSFQAADTQQREQDEAANPAYLWVEEGRALWQRPEGPTAASCQSCHGAAETAMKGVAARYPRVEARSTPARLVNLEGQINACRTDRQQAPPLAYESSELLALTALLALQSRGQPRAVAFDGPASPFLAAGRALWQTRQGQLDLACTQCHDGLAGRMLRGDRISQGQSDGWPAYRLEWQTLGSLHRRLRACSLGVRAEVLDYGAPEYLALELYLAWRGEGLPLSAPGLRR